MLTRLSKLNITSEAIFFKKSFIFHLSLSLRPNSQDKEALDEEEETLGATYILLLTILTLLFVFLIINVIVLLLM